MAKKSKKRAEEQPRQPTRRQRAQSAKQEKQDRQYYMATAIIVGIVVLLVIIGAVQQFLWRPNSTLASVNGESIITRDYWKRTLFQQTQLQSQLVRYRQLEEQFGGQGFFNNQISQIQATLSDPFSLGTQVLDNLINELVILEEAEKRGISVSEEEVDQALREEVAASQSLVTEAQATSTSEAMAIATATAESWTPTPTPTISVGPTITPTATLEPVPTRAIITQEQYDEGLGTLSTNLGDLANLSIDEYREIVRRQLIGEKLSEEVGVELVETTEEQASARHVLISIREPTATPTELPADSPTLEPTPTPTELPEGFPEPTATPGPRGELEAEALAGAVKQLLESGSDFGEIAADYSDDPGSGANGGDLGWFSRGVMVPEFEEAAFSLPIGEISDPIQTQFGFHVIEVLERDENRPKEESTVDQERRQAYAEWIQERVLEAEVERPSDLLDRLPAELR
ncbi:MAG: peptidylprolyl isomerase [Chloroflexota bacterium]